jgi:hypothetical protein
MDTTHEPNHNLLTAIFLFVGFLTNIISHLVENYDVAFKLMSLVAVGLGVIVNLDKAVKVIWGYCVSVFQWIKKK